jgi:hypothetical protein
LETVNEDVHRNEINVNNQSSNSGTIDIEVVLKHLESLRLQNSSSGTPEKNWFKVEDVDKMKNPNSELVALLGYCFEMLSFLSTEFQKVLESNSEREESNSNLLMMQFAIEAQKEKFRESVISSMTLEDPRYNKKNISDDSSTIDKIGSHLAPVTRLEALTRVEGQFRSNNDSTSSVDRSNVLSPEIIQMKKSIQDYDSIDDLAISLSKIFDNAKKNMTKIQKLIERKDFHYSEVKKELVSQMVEKRKREEGSFLFLNVQFIFS